MIAKYVCSFVVVGAAIMAGLASAHSGECDIAGYNRNECGWVGIDEATCIKRDCCWDSSVPRAKYCFLKSGKTTPHGRCPIAPYKRVECGYYGIKKEECLNKACCWDDTVAAAKWCFKQPDEPPLACRLPGAIYGTCHYTCPPGVNKFYDVSECQGRICCYKP